MIMRARVAFRIFFACVCCPVCFCVALAFRFALADSPTAEDITPQCEIQVSQEQEGLPFLFDGNHKTYWGPLDDGHPTYVQVDTPPDAPAYGLYIVWAHEPKPWLVTTPDPDDLPMERYDPRDSESLAQWLPYRAAGQQRYVHEYVALDGLTSFRIQQQHAPYSSFAIAGLYVLGEGAVPDWVQTWQPIPPRVDLMVIATHPDDEFIYLGGTLPVYAGERKLPTAVVYMTFAARHRRSELLDGLWHAGVRTYPVMGDFMDIYTLSYDQAAAYWGEEAVCDFLTEQIRRYKPKVVVTQDENGEYGNGMHKLTSEQTLECVSNLVWDETSFPESAAQYGTCEVEKLYLHLYWKNTVLMDWRRPLTAFGGRTALEVADEGFLKHESQQGYYKVLDSGEHNNAAFGLAFTTVGPDVEGKDFFENVTLWGESEPQ